jgi:hypothetical protein
VHRFGFLFFLQFRFCLFRCSCSGLLSRRGGWLWRLWFRRWRRCSPRHRCCNAQKYLLWVGIHNYCPAFLRLGRSRSGWGERIVLRRCRKCPDWGGGVVSGHRYLLAHRQQTTNWVSVSVLFFFVRGGGCSGDCGLLPGSGVVFFIKEMMVWFFFKDFIARWRLVDNGGRSRG